MVAKNKGSGQTGIREETEYSLSYGQGLICGISYKQLKELHDTIRSFIERESNPSGCKTETYGIFPVEMSKTVSRYSHDDGFFIDYGVETFDSNLQCMGTQQLKRVALSILAFLGKFEEKEEVSDTEDTTSNGLFCICKSSKQPVMKAAPLITKYVTQCDNEEAKITYFVGVNELELPELSFHELKVLYDKLGKFLRAVKE